MATCAICCVIRRNQPSPCTIALFAWHRGMTRPSIATKRCKYWNAPSWSLPTYGRVLIRRLGRRSLRNWNGINSKGSADRLRKKPFKIESQNIVRFSRYWPVDSIRRLSGPANVIRSECAGVFARIDWTIKRLNFGNYGTYDRLIYT